MVELALLLPILVLLLLGAVDVSHVLSIQQRLARATHLAALRLLVSPSIDLSAMIQAESGLSPVTVADSYTLDPNGENQATITATYEYPLLMPGLRNLQTQTISNGTLHVAVRASGIASTSAPTVLQAGATMTVVPPSDDSVPPGLTLTCTLLKDGLPVAHGPCRSAVSGPAVPSARYTATVQQVNGVVSPASAAVIAS